jgi:hypothetical protein
MSFSCPRESSPHCCLPRSAAIHRPPWPSAAMRRVLRNRAFAPVLVFHTAVELHMRETQVELAPGGRIIDDPRAFGVGEGEPRLPVATFSIRGDTNGLRPRFFLRAPVPRPDLRGSRSHLLPRHPHTTCGIGAGVHKRAARVSNRRRVRSPPPPCHPQRRRARNVMTSFSFTCPQNTKRPRHRLQWPVDGSHRASTAPPRFPATRFTRGEMQRVARPGVLHVGGPGAAVFHREQVSGKSRCRGGIDRGKTFRERGEEPRSGNRRGALAFSLALRFGFSFSLFLSHGGRRRLPLPCFQSSPAR